MPTLNLTPKQLDLVTKLLISKRSHEILFQRRNRTTRSLLIKLGYNPETLEQGAYHMDAKGTVTCTVNGNESE